MIRFPGWGKLLTSEFSLPYTFDVVAWEGWDKRRHGGTPGRPQQAKALKVLVTNPDNAGDSHQFWAPNTSPSNAFQDWSEWWTYIGGLMVMHGMDLADEPPSDDDEPGGYFEDEDYEDEEPEPEPLRPTIGQRITRFLGRIFGR